MRRVQEKQQLVQSLAYSRDCAPLLVPFLLTPLPPQDSLSPVLSGSFSVPPPEEWGCRIPTVAVEDSHPPALFHLSEGCFSPNLGGQLGEAALLATVTAAAALMAF